ncbi:MAG: VWA domain-containing protein [Hyphomicrobiaceae bacterium]|nr:VWA domain-containing protein [Hyphomicrobiaceae bacterium]
MIFAGSLFLLIGGAGVAIDSLRWQMAIYRTQTAMDTAVLAAGRVLQLPETTAETVIETAQTYYRENQTANLVSDVVNFSLIEDSSMVMGNTQGSKINTAFLNIMGFDTLPVNVRSTAALDTRQTEISMMLDVTGSMGEDNKLENLQIASKTLIDTVLTDGLIQNQSRIAIIPFSTFVNIGREYFQAATGTPPFGVGNQYSCVAERDNENRYTDEPPDIGNYFTHIDNYYPYDPSRVCPTSSPIMPLSNNKAELKKRIDNFTTVRSSTAGHIGTAWSWYVLSPKWRDFWLDGHKPASSGEEVRKIAILMTDGDYNAQYSGERSTVQAEELCRNMKNENITIYTIAFDVSSTSTAGETMQNCATTPTSNYYYNASDGAALKAAYKDIARQIFSLRLVE